MRSLRLRRPDGDEGKDAVEVELHISQGGVSRRSFSVVFLSASSDESENMGRYERYVHLFRRRGVHHRWRCIERDVV